MQQQDIIEIAIGEHTFVCPPIPPKKDILFSKLPKKEQFWQRELIIKEFPAFFFDWERGVIEDAPHTKYEGKRLIALSVGDSAILKSLRDREIKRIQDGIWFMNDGEPTYLTGGHYGVLMYCAMVDSLNNVESESLYGQYMQFQRNYAYFIEICKTTKQADGGNVVKPKKTGITMFQCMLILMDAIISRQANYRLMSTKEDVATKINFSYILYALRKLPEILKPEYRNNLSEIFFEDTSKGQRSGGKQRYEYEHLNSVIETVATEYNSFDSGKNRVAWIDEQSKIKIIGGKDLMTLHNTTIPTVSQGFIRGGYVIYTHYVSESNDKSFRLARQIYFESKLKTIDEGTGKTKSRLLCYAMTALDGTFGACDKYGKPEISKIWTVINAELDKRKDDPAALRAYRRQMPTCEADCWQEGAGEASIFDNLRLGMKLHDITEDDSVSVFPYQDFNFKWTIPPIVDDVKGIFSYPGKIIVAPVTAQQKRDGKEHGLWKWYMPEWTPREFLDKHVNQRLTDKKGKLIPNPGCPFYMSIDPTQYSAAKDVSVGSKNAMQVFILPNSELDGMANKKVSNKRLMVEYLHRAESPRDTLMHAIQTILYFGCYVLVECNANWLATQLKECGLANFLIRVNKDTGVLEPYNEWGNQKPFTSQRSVNGSNDTIGEYIAAGMMHINDYSYMDNVETLYSSNVIIDLMNFEPENTKDYDAGVCYLIGLLGINAYLGWQQRHLQKATRGGNESMRLAVVLLR